MNKSLQVFVFAVGLMTIAGCTSPSLPPHEESHAPKDSAPEQIEVELRCIAFKRVDIDRLMRTKKNVNLDSVMDLFNSGKGTVLFAPRALTSNGMECTVKGTAELIYPTDSVDILLPTGPVGTNVPPSYPINDPTTPGFETREAGVIASIFCEYFPKIDCVVVTMTGDLVFNPKWQSHTIRRGSTEFTVQQPVFSTQQIRESFTMPNNGTVLVGGGTPNLADETLVYSILTVRVLPVDKRNNESSRTTN